MILALQSDAATQAQRVDAALESLKSAETAALSSLWAQDSPPVWSASARADLLANGRAALGEQWGQLQAYLRAQWTKLIYFVLLLCALALFLIRSLPKVRQGAYGWTGHREPALAHADRILQWPLLNASVLAFLSTPLLFSGAPRLFWFIDAVIALVPVVMLLRRLIDPHFFPALDGVALIYVASYARTLAVKQPVFSRAALLVEAVIGVLIALWVGRSTSFIPEVLLERKLTRAAAHFSALLFAFVIIANSLGYVALASLISTGTVSATYLAIVLYTGANIVKSLLFVALQLWPLSSLGFVGRHRPLLRARIGRVISVVAFALWALAGLKGFSLSGPVLQWLQAVLESRITLGTLQVTPGGIVAFGLTIWISVLLSRFVRFVLEEDVYERVGLAQSSSYVISTISRYVILLVGFLLSLSALGVDMTRLTILAGAFSIGVGFGVQAIFNNFLSGIILLLERPVRIGDVIDVSGASGVVRQIGIRASKIKQADGSVLIVPNAQLISGIVINRHAPSGQAEVTFPVRVAHGSDPARVLEILTRVAAAQPRVARDPAPQVLMKQFDAEGLLFEVDCWTDDPDQAPNVRSGLAVAVATALHQEGIAPPTRTV